MAVVGISVADHLPRRSELGDAWQLRNHLMHAVDRSAKIEMLDGGAHAESRSD